MVKGPGDFIDLAIDDPFLQAYDWRIAIFIFVGNMAAAMETKWCRVSYIQQG